jgi:hypothetical protein
VVDVDFSMLQYFLLAKIHRSRGVTGSNYTLREARVAVIGTREM